jgi:hypothetical protein
VLRRHGVKNVCVHKGLPGLFLEQYCHTDDLVRAAAAAFRTLWLILNAGTLFGIDGALFPINVIAWISLIAFWTFPFGAGLWRVRAGTRGYAECPFMDAVPSALPSAEPPLRVRRALLIGASVSLMAGVALPWLRAPLPPGALRDIGAHETVGAAAFLSMTITCMVVQGVIAVIAALAVPRLQVPHAMFAALSVAGS